MKGTQQHDPTLVFTYTFILMMTVLILLWSPFAQQVLEQVNHYLEGLLTALKYEISRSQGF